MVPDIHFFPPLSFAYERKSFWVFVEFNNKSLMNLTEVPLCDEIFQIKCNKDFYIFTYILHECLSPKSYTQLDMKQVNVGVRKYNINPADYEMREWI